MPCCEPEDGQVRSNSWDWPPSNRQTITVSVVVVDAVLYSAFLAQLFDGNWRIGLLATFWVFFASTVVNGLITMTVNPVDQVTLEEDSMEKYAKDDMLWCNRCESPVQVESKHCFDCNKCVDCFDHHCPWLNTCIGSRNYHTWFAAAWSLLLMLGMLAATTLALLAENAGTGLALEIYGMGGGVLLGLFIVILVIHLPLWALTLSLICFHVYLCYWGVTTYDYMTGKVSKRKEEQRAKKKQEPKPQASANAQAAGGALPPPAPSSSWSPPPSLTPNWDWALQSNLSSSSAFAAAPPPVASPPHRVPTATSPASAGGGLVVLVPSGSAQWPVVPAATPLMSRVDSFRSEPSLSSQARSDFDDDGSSGSEAGSDSSIMNPVFRSYVAREHDSELMKSVSGFVFGSGFDDTADANGDPEALNAPL